MGMTPGTVTCPKCSSPQVVAGQQGLNAKNALIGGVLLGPAGLAAGMFGNRKVTLTCVACGHQWSPPRPAQTHHHSADGTMGMVVFGCGIVLLIAWGIIWGMESWRSGREEARAAQQVEQAEASAQKQAAGAQAELRAARKRAASSGKAKARAKPKPKRKYDVTFTKAGNYRTPEILPFEREVFEALQTEFDANPAPDPDAFASDEEFFRADKAAEDACIRHVAGRYGLTPKLTNAIYMKVGLQDTSPG
jgi:hypothetical protein